MLKNIKTAYRTWLLDQSDENLELLKKSISNEKENWKGTFSFPRKYEEAVEGKNAEMIIDEFEEIIRREGEHEGFNEGFDDGYNVGFEGGYDEGFNEASGNTR